MTRKYSGEYKKYQPYVVEDIRKVVGAVGGSATGGSGMQVHTLSGPYHSGELAQSQASWAATKVELSNHAALPDVHHAKVHAITDAANHSVTGSQYQIVGLTAVNTLGLLTPSASPAANAVVKTDGASGVTLVDLTVTSDLFMSGYLDFGTDVMYEDASYLQVTGSKPVRFSQNIGNANWTVYNTGGASFGGSVDIVGSGDLYVAGSLGGAGGVLKTSGNRVGIACVPDSQFALDVAGPARAQYFIGPHAIQLKDATMILHFDGAAPYATNYNGILLGHKGQTATVSGGYVFRPGKFGKAIQITRAGNNAVTHPSFELGTLGSTPTGWDFAGAGSLVKSSDVAYYGDYSAKLTVAAQWAYPSHTLSGGINLNSAQTVSAWVWVESYTSGTLTLSVQRTDTFAEVMQVNVDTSAGKRKQWQRVSATWPGSGGGTVAARVKLQTSNPATMTVYIDAVQVEPYVYCSPYIDGSVNQTGGTAHAWTTPASPHASGSTRTAAELYYAIGNVDPREGTVSAWVYVDGFYNNNRLFHFRNDDGSFDYYLASTGGAIFRYNSTSIGGGTLAARTWHHVAVTWSLESGYAYTFLDGVQTGAAAITGPTLVDATLMSIGHKWGTSQLNGMIDDFAILSTAASANQVRAIYESNAPVFAESSTVSWVATPSGLVWADERGLWMRDTAGNSVLGVYGGEAATYSWAGFTMASGDLVLGRNAVGSSAIWWDQSTGKFGFYGAGSGTPQVEIATDGILYAGTAGAQRVQLSSTELAGYNSSNVKQWYGSTTDGKLYAASGKTWLEKNGLSILAPAAADLGVENYVGWATQGNLSTLSGYITCGFTSSSGNPSGTMQIIVNAGGGTSRITLGAAILQLNGMTTSASAVGAYSGKLKININGVGDVYIPYYAS